MVPFDVLFLQQLYNDEHDFLEAESLTHANEKSSIISHNWKADGLTRFQTRDRQYMVSNVQTRHFPTIYQRFLWFWVRADRLLKTSTRRSSKHSVPEVEMEESVLEKEPIDVVFKYIDLSDPNLIREGILQIRKDEDNEELRYALRTALGAPELAVGAPHFHHHAKRTGQIPQATGGDNGEK